MLLKCELCPVQSQELSLKEKGYKAIVLTKLDDKDNPLDPINDIHSLIKKFMKLHGGFNREKLQDWMNLISFILNPPNDRYEKALKFINMAIRHRKSVRFQDFARKRSNPST